MPTSSSVAPHVPQEHVAHRDARIDERVAEIQAQRVTQVVHVLRGQRQVQPELLDLGLLRLRRELDPALPGQEPNRIAGHDPEQEEVHA